MKSPFPGMDPYVERTWRDLHSRLCVYSCDAIQPQVRPALLARVDERLVVESFIEKDRPIYPDVRVVERHPSAGVATAVRNDATKPLLIHLGEQTEEGFIQITDPADGNRIVTVIEFLSKSNKDGGDGEHQYRKKAEETIDGGANLVEIDLLRTGGWVVQVPTANVPAKYRSAPYKVCVRRASRQNRREFYPIFLQDRLPKILIPLRSSDTDAVLDLQTIFDQAYANGGYDEIDYSLRLTPGFDRETTAWIAKQIRSERPPAARKAARGK
jgi:hypothetical protein